MEILKRLNGDLKPYAICMLVTLVVFQLFYGLHIVNPTNINWVMSARHDWGQHYLGWAFWRNEPWTFPLGAMKNYIYPLGSNMGFTDSIPLMALIFKPFSALLPDNFQYLGLWLLICYVLSAHYTYKICQLYQLSTLYTVAVVLLVVANPVLLYRMIHPALCSHFFIIAAIYYYLTPATPHNTARINRNQLILAVFAASVNPYITAMVMGFNIILPLKHVIYARVLSWPKAIGYMAGSVAGVLVVWIVIGLIQFGGESLAVAGGYGPFAYNLNSMINGNGFSPLLPEMPWVNPQQYEGYMYLGFGFILFIIVAVLVFAVTGKPATVFKQHKWLLPLFFITLFMVLFAVTNKITYNDKVLAEIPLPNKLVELGSIFRASGRFVWPAYYLLMLFTLIIFIKSKLPAWAKYSVLALTIALQAYDIVPLAKTKQLAQGDYDSPLDENKWDAVMTPFSNMVTYQPFNNHLLTNMDYQDLCFLALKHKMGITTGYSARDNAEAYRNITDSITADLFAGKVNPKDLYVTTKQNVDVFGALLHSKKLDVQYLDGYFLLYDKNAKARVVSTDEHSRFVADSLKNAFAKAPFIKEIPTPVVNNALIDYTIEEISMGETSVRVKGWAYRKDTDNNKGDEVYATVTDNGVTRIANTQQIKRPDLTTFFKKTYLEDSGYASAFFGDVKWTPQTRLGLAIKTAQDKWYYADLGPLLLLDRNKKPTVLAKLPKAGKVIGNVDDIKIEGNFVFVNGWAAFEDASSVNTTIKVAFIGKQAKYLSSTAVAKRDDVTKALNNTFNYDNSGYNLKADITAMKKGTYQIGLIVSGEGREEIKILSDKTFEVE